MTTEGTFISNECLSRLFDHVQSIFTHNSGVKIWSTNYSTCLVAVVRTERGSGHSEPGERISPVYTAKIHKTFVHQGWLHLLTET